MSDHRAVRALAAMSRRMPPVKGKGELARRLMVRSERGGNFTGAWNIPFRDGTRLTLPFESIQTWIAAFQGSYDRAAVEYVARFIRPDSLVLDVGASLGLWTVPLARAAAARDAQVWAFEPNPANIPWIDANLEQNGLSPTVTVRATALGDDAGSLTLVGTEYGVGNGAIAVAERQATAKFPRMSVDIERLDDVSLPRPVSFIKIDTEGYECAFIRGAVRVIAQDRPVIFGEFASRWLQQRGEDLRATLAGLDYRVTALTGMSSRPWRSIDRVVEREVDLAREGPIPSNLLLHPL